MGLCVAIPTLMVYYALLMKFKGFHLEVVEYSYRALDLYRRQKDCQGRCGQARQE